MECQTPTLYYLFVILNECEESVNTYFMYSDSSHSFRMTKMYKEVTD